MLNYFLLNLQAQTKARGAWDDEMIDISHKKAKNKECYDIYIKSTVGGSCGTQHNDTIAKAMHQKSDLFAKWPTCDPLISFF